MPSTDFPTEDFDVPLVSAFGDALEEALQHARIAKSTSSIEPALTKAELGGLFMTFSTIFPSLEHGQPPAATVERNQSRQYAVIETAARKLFSRLIASTSIDSPEFVQVWNLFDILAALSDSELSEPALLFWLVEELIDSQTIDGCRKTFDYLESRRERFVEKHFKPKNLVMLRLCNALLRRLSRAEDTAFCGRVFIFTFQWLPLGERSSVNLRGEFHVENVTIYEETPAEVDEGGEKMDIDTTVETNSKDGKDSKPQTNGTKAVTTDAKGKPAPKKTMDTDSLYPIFWSLQHYFSQPTKLFEAQELAKFKSGMDATVTKFESVGQDSKETSKKRKRLDDTEPGSTSFNAKYLTSRDLFELELNDLFFRRHFLIQAAIILEFLRTLTAKAKAKHANIAKPNKLVMYADVTLSEEDDKWAEGMRKRIDEYVLAGPDGSFFNRIIQTVTSRDKGWLRWKMEGCPSFVREPVSPGMFVEAKAAARGMARNKRLRLSPMGSLPLDFLEEEDPKAAMCKFQDPARWQLPDTATYQSKIADDDFDLSFDKSEQEKAPVLESKASKTWRALRLTGRRRLATFDAIEDWQDIRVVFEEPKQDAAVKVEEKRSEESTWRMPDDKRPIVISGPRGAGKSTLVAKLLEQQPGIFEKMPRHTTQARNETAVEGQDYHFVDLAEFNVMLDGDQFLEFSEPEGPNGVKYGTNRKIADAISGTGKIPVIQLDGSGVRSAKENAFAARFVFISPASIEELCDRLRKAGNSTDAEISALQITAQEEMDQAKVDGAYDCVVVNDNLEKAYEALESFLYGSTSETNGVHGANGASGDDVAMEIT